MTMRSVAEILQHFKTYIIQEFWFIVNEKKIFKSEKSDNFESDFSIWSHNKV